MRFVVRSLALVVPVLFGLGTAGCAAEETAPTAATGDDAEVIGGREDVEHPEVGELTYGPKGSTPEKFFCTGTLVGPRLVLTAAHCLLSVADKAGPDAEIAFHAGDASYIATYGDVHPSNARGMSVHQDDLAFIVLAKAVKGIKPATVGAFKPAKKADCNLTMVGFGQTVAGAKLDKIEPNKRSLDVCTTQASLPGFIGVSAEKGAGCYGDSGGPLFRRGESTLYGVLNGGQWGGACGDGKVSDYVDVGAHADFLKTAEDAVAKY